MDQIVTSSIVQRSFRSIILSYFDCTVHLHHRGRGRSWPPSSREKGGEEGGGSWVSSGNQRCLRPCQFHFQIATVMMASRRELTTVGDGDLWRRISSSRRGRWWRGWCVGGGLLALAPEGVDRTRETHRDVRSTTEAVRELQRW